MISKNKNIKPFRWRGLYLFLTFTLLVTIIGCGSESTGPDIDEELSGGDTTVFATAKNSFALPAENLDFEQRALFGKGNSFFEQPWVTAPASAKARDGLGPTFNANSCASCHVHDGRGLVPESPNETPLGLLFRISVPGKNAHGGPNPEPNYGGQLQPHSILDVPTEVSISVDYEEVPGNYGDGEFYSLRRPIYEFSDFAFGPMDPEVMVSPRIAPQMIGMGLLEAVPESTLLEFSDPEDQDGDQISGRANYVWDGVSQSTVIGRFGWKANVPNIESQVAGAFLGDIGITTPLFIEQNCTEVQEACLAAPTGSEDEAIPEIEQKLFDAVVFYSQTLAVPARRNWDDPEVLKGKKIFTEMDCAKCHRPQLKTSENFSIGALSNQTIRPYTDLLLHDMGEELADHRSDFEAQGKEWRTPPLWGLGLVETVNGKTNFLHDGRARNFEEAILWHGGEAANAKEKFRTSSKSDREALIQFLKSL